MTDRLRTLAVRRNGLATVCASAAVLLAACSDPTSTATQAEPGATVVTTQVVESTATVSPRDQSSTTGTGSMMTETTEAMPLVPWPEVELSLNPIVQLTQPTALVSRPGSDDLWVAERPGRVRLIERAVNVTAGTERLRLLTEPVIDISGQVTTAGEGGLLGLAFSPDGQLLYLHYTNRSGNNIISEVQMGATTADAGSERVLLEVDEPFSSHNGGDLAFGPDDLLYISLGDGGSAGDPLGSGQDRTSLLGSLLRIDPRPVGDRPYGIPDDNPFVGSTDGSRPEIWIWGVRNPWRFSFDAATGDLWVADVGENRFEEINFLPAAADRGRGANLGWNLVEGNEPFAGDPPPDHVPPLHVYPHEQGRCSVTGGYVYHGSAIPALDGVYLYSDYCSGEVTGIERSDGRLLVANLILDRPPEKVIGFGQGPEGELFVLEQNGRVSRVQSPDWPLETLYVSG